MRYLITFSYDGTNFEGYQKQIFGRTVQHEIESVLSKIFNQKILLSASGRTDKGVHAINQKAHFDGKEIDLSKLKHSMNSLLPSDIYIKNIEVVNDDFHARYDVKEKEYIYKINLGEYNPLENNYVYQYNKKLNVRNMKKAIKYFIGEHDFKSFSTDAKEKDTVRKIYKAKISVHKNILTIKFVGNGFIRYMVRNMVGLLIEIGENKRNYKCVKEIILLKDRTKSGIKAPACGLYLNNVKY